MGASDWGEERNNLAGPADRVARFDRAARAFADCQRRNRNPIDGGAGCPIIVEGLRDEAALRALGFEGPVERMNRGWDRSRLVAYLYDKYGTRNTVDGGPPLILLMDWDRTGGRLQTALRNRTRLISILKTIMKFEKKNKKAQTEMNRFQSAAHSGRLVKSSVVMK